MTGKKQKKNYYDGLNFHRVIPDFMIQVAARARWARRTGLHVP